MNWRTMLGCLALLATLPATSARAQDTPADTTQETQFDPFALATLRQHLYPGEHARITVGGRTYTLPVLRPSESGLLFDSKRADAEARSLPQPIPWQAVERVDIRRDHAKGMALGLGVIGGLLAFALGMGATGECDEAFEIGCGASGEDVVVATVAGAGAGMLVGAVFGYFIPRWVPIYPQPWGDER